MGIRGSVSLQAPRNRRRSGAAGRLLGVSLAVSLVATLLAGVGPAGAGFPGANGKIAFVSNRDGDGEIFVMNADGSAQTQLTNNGVFDGQPAWSPDGTRIAFASSRAGVNQIFVMNADGSAQTQLTFTNRNHQPAWSPDGTKIAFSESANGFHEIFVMNADGSAPIQLTADYWTHDHQPAWSPDGTKIAFRRGEDGYADSEIIVMNADGSAETQLTFGAYDEIEPAWSPDGTKIAFQSWRPEGAAGDFEIVVMNADGSAQTQLTFNTGTGSGGMSALDGTPAWSPDGARITFESNRTGDYEIFTMNPDGTAQTQLTGNTAIDNIDNQDPDWQPVLASSRTTLRVIKKERRVVAKGLVSPDHAGERVVVKLFKKRGDKFVLQATKHPTLDSSSRYGARFKRVTPGRCLVRARFGGDADHLPSVTPQKFRC